MSVTDIDVCNQATMNTARIKIEKESSKLDIVINNTAIAVYQQVDTLTSRRRTFETNVSGQVIVTEAQSPSSTNRRNCT